MGGTIWGLFLLFVFVGLPILLIVNYFKRRSHQKQSMENGLIYFKQIFDSEPRYSFFNEGTGIAISKDSKQVGIVDGDRRKIYSTDNIRSHKIELVLPGQYSGTGVRGSLQAAANNQAAATVARSQSGLFVQTKDVENPEWRIKMYNKADQNRWHEIFTQLYEGSLS